MFDKWIKNAMSKSNKNILRTMTILASSRNNLTPSTISSLIHNGLLDNDPLVQQAATLVIEENLGISLKNGVYALLIKKGIP